MGELETSVEKTLLEVLNVSPEIRREYHWILRKKPGNILNEASILKDIRKSVDTFPNPIHVIKGTSFFFDTQFTNFASNISNYLKKFAFEINNSQVNHYRIFYKLDSKDFDGFAGKKNIVAFTIPPNKVIQRNTYADKIFYKFPVIAVKELIWNNPPEFARIIKHEDSHAFDHGIRSPEEVYGYSQADNGQGEKFARRYLGEVIAALEENCPHMLEVDFFEKYDHKNYDKRTKTIIEKCNEAIEKVKSKVRSEDLAYILRVVPAQVMDETLPKLVKAYQNNGLTWINR